MLYDAKGPAAVAPGITPAAGGGELTAHLRQPIRIPQARVGSAQRSGHHGDPVAELGAKRPSSRILLPALSGITAMASPPDPPLLFRLIPHDASMGVRRHNRES